MTDDSGLVGSSVKVALSDSFSVLCIRSLKRLRQLHVETCRCIMPTRVSVWIDQQQSSMTNFSHIVPGLMQMWRRPFLEVPCADRGFFLERQKVPLRKRGIIQTERGEQEIRLLVALPRILKT